MGTVEITDYPRHARGKVEVPDTVTGIVDWGFADCGRLAGIRLPEGLRRIGDASFYSGKTFSGMASPRCVNRISWVAIAGCEGLRAVVMPHGVGNRPSWDARAFAE